MFAGGSMLDVKLVTVGRPMCTAIKDLIHQEVTHIVDRKISAMVDAAITAWMCGGTGCESLY
jgi:hypothetical protein